MKDKIIQALNASEDYLSGEEISRVLHISRAAIWKNIEELRKDGYVIEAAPHRGYRIKQRPDKLYPREVLENLSTVCIGQRIHYYNYISSTMDEAYDLARRGADEGEVVLTEGQTKGRGRMGRVWQSPKYKGLYCSFILRPSLKPSDVAKMTLMTGVALCEAIFMSTGIQTQIKWPNDLLFKGKKVAGILTELNAEMDRIHFCIVGAGINVNTLQHQLPETATSLKLILGKKISRRDVFQEICRRMEYWYDHLQNQRFQHIFTRWKALSYTLGQHVSVGRIEGTAVDIDEYGALIIEQPNGKRVKQLSGDVAYV